MNLVMALPFYESRVLSIPILASSYFLRQFNCHSLGNNVFLNRQFSLFLLVEKAIPFVAYMVVELYLFPPIHGPAQHKLVWILWRPIPLVHFHSFFGFCPKFVCVVSFHYLHLFFLFFCSLQKKVRSTLLLASSALVSQRLLAHFWCWAHIIATRILITCLAKDIKLLTGLLINCLTNNLPHRHNK